MIIGHNVKCTQNSVKRTQKKLITKKHQPKLL